MTHTNNTTARQRHPLARWLAATATAAALVATSSAATATAQTDNEAPVDIAVSSYAADYSVTHQEAQRRLDRIQSLQAILADIRGHETARLAGWGIDHTGTFTGWVWLTGNEAPSIAAATIADAHADVQIRTGADHTLDQLLTTQTGLFQDIGPVGQATSGSGPATTIRSIVTYTNIDMRANAIQIGIDPALASTVPDGLTDLGPVAVTHETLQTTITEVTSQLQAHINVTYTVEDGRGLSVDAADFKGGEAMSGCTSGFAAQDRNTDVYGLITAGHCFRANDNPITMHGARLPLVVRAWGPYVDAQFRSIPTGANHRIFDDYICGEGSPCDVRDDIAKGQMLNNYICHHGRSSGESCGTVTSINYFPRSANACETSCSNAFVLVEGNTLKRCRGDSGGPWYDRGYAFGIHGGGSGGDDCDATGKTAYFSAIRSVEDHLGVDILTTGPFTVN